MNELKELAKKMLEALPPSTDDSTIAATCGLIVGQTIKSRPKETRLIVTAAWFVTLADDVGLGTDEIVAHLANARVGLNKFS